MWGFCPTTFPGLEFKMFFLLFRSLPSPFPLFYKLSMVTTSFKYNENTTNIHDLGLRNLRHRTFLPENLP